MIFKICSFLTFALALASLDAVTATFAPKNVDAVGPLNSRAVVPVGVAQIYILSPERSNKGCFCDSALGPGSFNDSEHLAALPLIMFQRGRKCNDTMTVGINYDESRGGGEFNSVRDVRVADVCPPSICGNDGDPYVIAVSIGTALFLKGLPIPENVTYFTGTFNFPPYS